MQAQPVTSKSFLKKISGLLLLSLLLFAWRSADDPLNSFLTELRLKLDQLYSKNSLTKVYLVCDKPLYGSGEVIWYSIFTRDGNTQMSQPGRVFVSLINPQGAVEASTNLYLATNSEKRQGSIKGNFNLKPDQVGGLYKIKVEYYSNTSNYGSQNLPTEPFIKEIQVQDVVMPRLKLTLDFEHKAYGPGSTVMANIKAFTNENRPLSSKNFDYVVSLQGNQVQTGKATIDAKGNGLVRFQLPAELASTDGHLNLIFTHEGIAESVSKSIPIVLNKIQLSFFPEGGDLVDGLSSKLAFRALNEFNKPADVNGEVLDEKGKVVASFSSFHDGMGEFDFKPEADKSYKARLTSPAGIKTEYPLPQAMPAGFVMEVLPAEKNKLTVNIRSTITGKAAIVGQMRGKIQVEEQINIKPGDNLVEISTLHLPIGILQLTLFDHKTIERAERLVFVNNHKLLQLKIKTDKEKYLPREKVKLTITATDETGLPMPADLAVSVVDDQLLTYMNDKSSNLLSWMLVESEIKGKVDEPKFYFDKEESKAPMALDLLLKTAGWRRFNWEQVKKEQLLTYQYSGENLLPKQNYRITTTTNYRGGISGQLITDPEINFQGQSTLKLIQNGKIIKTMTVDGTGPFFMPSVMAGTYDLEITTPNYKRGLITGIKVQQFATPFVTLSLPLLLKDTAPIPGSASLRGTVVDKTTREPIPFGNVVVKNNGIQKGYAQTDINGNYFVTNLAPGTYTVEMPNVGYLTQIIKGVKINGKQTTFLNGTLAVNTNALNEVEVVAYKEPLIGPDKQGRVLQQEEIRRLPAVDVKNMVTVAAGVFAADDGRGVAIRGNRANANQYYVNGVKQMVAPALPPAANANAKIARPEVNNRALDKEKLTEVRDSKAIATQNTTSHDYIRTREFAAPVYAEKTPAKERTDFRKTLFWAPEVSIGKSGVTTLEFYTGDAITSFNVMAEGFSVDGEPGRNEHKFFTQLPFSLAAKLPNATLQADRLSIPLILKNNTENDVSGKLKITHPSGWKFLGKENVDQVVKANSTNLVYLDYEVLEKPGSYNFGATFEAQGLQDAFSQPVTVEQRGYPIHKAIAGSTKEQEYALDISNMNPGTASVSFTAYPSVVTDLIKGVEGILQEPHGCFEQTSSSSYPNLMVLDYLKEQKDPNPTAMARAQELMDRGYNRLVTFETKEKGYEWFGGVPAHEGLTAYGLLQFSDMKRLGGKVDQNMLNRTQDWLLSRKDGNGGFERSSRSLDSYGRAEPAINNAYIVYSLTEAGYNGLDKELNQVCQEAITSNDPYQLALATNALYASGNKVRGQEFLSKLLKLQAENGSWTGTKHSITYSMGQSLQLETTSLAVLAMLKADQKPVKELNQAIKFLLQSRNNYGGFGSTQATILTLKALTTYARYSKRTAESGNVQLLVDRKKVGDQSYLADQTGEIQINDLNKHFTKPGNYVVKVQYQKTNTPLPYSMAISYFTNQPPSSPECKVKLETNLATTETSVGQTVRYVAKIKNLQPEGIPMTMALIGLPAGLSVQPSQLKELQEKKVIDFYEITGNRLVCYFRSMAPNAEVAVNLDLKAEFPGTYEGPASSAYLYYTNEHKNWSPGTRITIKP